MRVSSKVLSLLVCIVVASFAVVGCSSSATPTATSPTATSPTATSVASTSATSAPSSVSTADASNPIVVGGISTLTGGIPFVDLPPAVQTYFDMINSEGGVQGRELVYDSLDDGGSPSEAAADARDMLLQQNAVGFIGNASLVDCATNENYYEQMDAIVVGLGPQPQCFDAKNWLPINPGPYVGTGILLNYAYSTLGLKEVCVIGQNEAGSIDFYKSYISAFEKSQGVTLPLVEFTNETTNSPEPEIVQAKNAGCDGIITSTMGPNWEAFIQAAKTVGWDGTFLQTGSTYDATVPGALGSLGDPGALGPNSKGLFVASELAPFSGTFAGLDTYKQWMQKENDPVNFWTEGGWLSADVFVHVLQSINGPITRDSVTKAFQTMAPYTSPFSGTPIQLGKYNRSSIMMTIQNGAWVQAPPNTWVTLP